MQFFILRITGVFSQTQPQSTEAKVRNVDESFESHRAPIPTLTVRRTCTLRFVLHPPATRPPRGRRECTARCCAADALRRGRHCSCRGAVWRCSTGAGVPPGLVPPRWQWRGGATLRRAAGSAAAALRAPIRCARVEAFFFFFFFLSIVLALPRDTHARSRACRPAARGPLMRVPHCRRRAPRGAQLFRPAALSTAVVVGVPVGVGGIRRRREGATAEERRRAGVFGRRLTPAPARAAARGTGRRPFCRRHAARVPLAVGSSLAHLPVPGWFPVSSFGSVVLDGGGVGPSPFVGTESGRAWRAGGTAGGAGRVRPRRSVRG